GRRGARGSSVLSPPSPPVGEGPGVRGPAYWQTKLAASYAAICRNDHRMLAGAVDGVKNRDGRTAAVWVWSSSPSSVSPFGRATFSHEGRRGARGSSVLSPPSPLVGEGSGLG